jgi:hypothetical protein
MRESRKHRRIGSSSHGDSQPSPAASLVLHMDVRMPWSVDAHERPTSAAQGCANVAGAWMRERDARGTGDMMTRRGLGCIDRVQLAFKMRVTMNQPIGYACDIVDRSYNDGALRSWRHRERAQCHDCTVTLSTVRLA